MDEYTNSYIAFQEGVPECQHSGLAGQGIEAICVDVSRMPYVSSAGLRVLLMMYKSLADKDKFEMTGVSEDVREILETTGFDQFLLKE